MTPGHPGRLRELRVRLRVHPEPREVWVEGILVIHHEGYARGALEAPTILRVNPGECSAAAGREARERLSGPAGARPHGAAAGGSKLVVL